MPAHTPRTVLLAAVAALTATLAVAAGASAQSGTFGETVAIDDDGVVRVLEDDGDLPDDWVFLKDDPQDDDDRDAQRERQNELEDEEREDDEELITSSGYDGSQSVYVVQTSSRFSKNDIRVGSGQVDARELDDDEELESLGGSLDFLDEDDDGEFDADDGVYYDVSDRGSGEVSNLDLHVAGASGSDGEDLDSYGGDFAYVDRDADEAYGEDDDVYLDTDGDGLLTAADVGFSGEDEGNVLSGDDDTVAHPLDTSAVPGDWTFQDADQDGRLDGDEPVYLSQSSSEVEVHDVRVANAGEGSEGDLVQPGDDDVANPTEGLDGELAFFDDDGDGRLGFQDTLYLDLDSGQSAKVSVHDVVLSGPDAGRLVDSGDANVGNGLEDLDGQLGSDDVDGDEEFTRDDDVYVDVDGDGFVSVRDVRLTDDLGRLVVAGDPQATITTTTSAAPSNLILVDDDGDESPDDGERAYLSEGTDRVGAGSVRVTHPEVGGLGSQVRSADGDFGDRAVEVDGTLAYRDLETDDAFNDEDVLYFDLSDGRSGDVSVGDVVLSGSDAGTVVDSGSENFARPLESYDGEIAFVDGDGDGNYEVGDPVVGDTDDDGFLTPGDVWLGGDELSQPSQTSSDEGDDSDDTGSTGENPPGGTARPATRTARVGGHFSAEADQRVRFTDNLPPDTAALGLTFDTACEGCSVHLSSQGHHPQDAAPVPAGWTSLGYRTIELLGEDDTPAGETVREGYYAFELSLDHLPEGARAQQVTLLHEADGTWAAVPTQLASGTSEDPIVVNATLAGLSTFAVAVDEAPPTLGDPQPTGSTSESTPEVSASWTDNGDVAPNTVTLAIDGTPQTNATGTFEVDEDGFTYVPEQALEDGPHSVRASVQDASQLSGSREWTFRVSDATCPTPPQITEVQPAPEATNVTADASIAIAVEEGTCSIVDSSVRVDGQAIPSTYANGRLTAGLPDRPASTASNGTVTITAEVVDEGSNPAERTWSIHTRADGPQGTDDGEGPQGTPSAGAAWTVLGTVAGALLATARRQPLSPPDR